MFEVAVHGMTKEDIACIEYWAGIDSKARNGTARILFKERHVRDSFLILCSILKLKPEWE